MKRRLNVYDARLAYAWPALGVLLGNVHATDHRANQVFLDYHAIDGAALAAILAGEHLHLIALLDTRLWGVPIHHYSTSGACDRILVKPRSRSSRATGPKMRVPRGLF